MKIIVLCFVEMHLLDMLHLDHQFGYFEGKDL